MKSAALFLFSIFALAQLTACGPAAEIANQALYPYSIANKIPVPEIATDNYEAAKVSANGTTTSLWASKYENPNAPVILYFHGNGENIGGLAKMRMLWKLSTLGAHVVAFDYPYYGLSTGELNQKGAVNSGDTAFRWTIEHFPNSPVIIWGRSLGSAIAIQVALANRQNVSKLILSQPWDELKKLALFQFPFLATFIPDSWFEINEYNSVKAAEQLPIPTLIHHGTVDKTIPMEMGESLAKSFPVGYATFRPVDGKDHNNLFQSKMLWDDVTQFIK